MVSDIHSTPWGKGNILRKLRQIDQYRDCSPWVVSYYGTTGDDYGGVFSVPSPEDGESLRVVASSAGGWDHVSVSRETRCPTWAEMDHIKRLFFKENEVAVQFHVAEEDHINVHPFCLHLWRNKKNKIELPPKIFV